MTLSQTKLSTFITAILSEARGWWDEQDENSLAQFKIGDRVRVYGTDLVTSNQYSTVFNITHASDPTKSIHTWYGMSEDEPNDDYDDPNCIFKIVDQPTEDLPGPYCLTVYFAGMIVARVNNANVELISSINEAKGWWDEPEIEAADQISFEINDVLLITGHSKVSNQKHELKVRVTSEKMFRSPEEGFKRMIKYWYVMEGGTEWTLERWNECDLSHAHPGPFYLVPVRLNPLEMYDCEVKILPHTWDL